MISICLEQLGEAGGGGGGEGDEQAALLQQWACVGVGRLWRGYEAARWAGVRDLAHEKLFPLLRHARAAVRAAAAHALAAFVAAAGPRRARTDHANALDQQVAVALADRAPEDAAALVRAEILAGTRLHRLGRRPNDDKRVRRSLLLYSIVKKAWRQSVCGCARRYVLRNQPTQFTHVT